MSFVDTIVEQLAKTGFESISKPQNFDASDNTFAKLLEKQMSAQEIDTKQDNLLGEMGMPAGMTIEPYDPNNISTPQDKHIELQNIMKTDLSDVEIKDFKIDNYLPDFMSELTKKDSPLMNIAMKYATSMYGTQGRSFVDNVADLADGLTGRL